jgi:hypothetical protein
MTLIEVATRAGPRLADGAALSPDCLCTRGHLGFIIARTNGARGCRDDGSRLRFEQLPATSRMGLRDEKTLQEEAPQLWAVQAP